VHYHAASKDGNILEGHSLILEAKPHLGYSHVNKSLSCLVLVSLSPFAVSQASFAWFAEVTRDLTVVGYEQNFMDISKNSKDIPD
jgi:hypothetical protein